MRTLNLLIVLVCALNINAQFTSGRGVDRNDNNGYYYVNAGGQIWEDSGSGYQYMGTAGANAGQMLIADGKLYIVRIDKVKVYDLDPFGLENTWDTPASEWMIGLAYDGNTTLYCHDTEVLYSVDITSGLVDTVFTDFTGNPGKMVYDPNEDRLLVLENGVGIWGYDIQNGTYDFLLSLSYHFLHDITPACGDKWLMAMEFNQGGGMLYTLPQDLSSIGDTIYWDFAIRPKGVYYEPMGDSALYVLESTVASFTEPCVDATSIEELSAVPAVGIVIGYDQLIVTWPTDGYETTQLRLFDMTGRSFYQGSASHNQLHSGHRVNVRNIPSGSYLLTLESNGIRITKSFVLMR